MERFFQKQNNILDFALLQVAREGDVMLMEKLLERITNVQQKKKRVNSKDESKLTPIHYAARYNHYHMIEFLIKNGASKLIVSVVLQPGPSLWRAIGDQVLSQFF